MSSADADGALPYGRATAPILIALKIQSASLFRNLSQGSRNRYHVDANDEQTFLYLIFNCGGWGCGIVEAAFTFPGSARERRKND